MPLLTSTSLGQFCREIAIQLSPLPVLLKEWSLSEREFEELRTSAGYVHEMTLLATEMQELGANAGYVYRMKALSEIFIADVVKIMNDAATPISTRVELIKWCAEMARLKDKPATPQQLQNPTRGPSVVFHFGPGLPVKSMTLVPEGTPEITHELVDPGRNAQPLQSQTRELEQVVPARPRGFQFAVPTDAD